MISLTLTRIEENPLFGFFFALGFSLGNVFGILLERRIPLGNLTLRVVGREEVRELAGQLQDLGLRTTLLKGEGKTGEKNMMFCFMPKRILPKVQPLLRSHRDEIFYTLDYGGISNKVLLPRTKAAPSQRRSPLRK